MDLPALLKSIYDAAPDALTFIDATGHIILFNRAAEQLTGFTSDEIQDIPMVELYPNAEDFARIHKLVETDGWCQGIETTIRSKSGELIPISISVAVVRDQSGVITGTVGISRDLRMIRHLQNQITRLEQSAVRMAIAAETAHEINNPLEIIKNYLYLIEKQYPDDVIRGQILIVQHELIRIARIVKSLTGLTLNIDFPQESIDVRQFVLQFRDLIIPWTVSHGIDLKISLPETLPILVSSTEHLKQIFLNLTLLAIKSMPKGGGFEIEVDSTEQDVFFVFRDSCELLFDEQELLRSIRKNPENQSEPGLPISYGLVGSLGGSLTIGMNQSGGSEYVVRIPLGNSR